MSNFYCICRGMSRLVHFLGAGQKMRRSSCVQKELDKFTEIEDLLTEKTDSLKKKIDQEYLNAKKILRRNKTEALQALRRKRWYEKHLKLINCAIKAMKSAHEHIETFNEVDLSSKEEMGTDDMSMSLLSSANEDAEYDEDDLLAELEKLERSLDENFFEGDTIDGPVHCPVLCCGAQTSAAEEEEIEEALEYLRRWANEEI